MEMANVTYQDENGDIKVIIDYDKCIVCGRCVSACKHEARLYRDDTERFFSDLAKGVPISVIAAPSIKTNVPGFKRMFTYLKQLGVNMIFDVSLGADICTWAHIRYIEQNSNARIITQPCPAIVTYCEMYRHDLLKNLSPVHSPMACTSVYMQKYHGNTDRIAALSPCMAKSVEFEETGLAQYNVTFNRLMKHIGNLQLPENETEFDHPMTGMGSLYPMPGGLKENIEFYLGKKLHIAKAEGQNVYDRLNRYNEIPEDLLPDIYDVLNCAEGCNIGTSANNERCVFEIAKTMSKYRKRTANEEKVKYYQALYNTYDKTLNPADFMRAYRSVHIDFPKINNKDISDAFELMGKDSYEKHHIDCGACGSDSCRGMARKIALKVNIAASCIVKSKDDAKQEHEEFLLAQAANKAKTVFLSHISHEIRTPINAVLGTAEIQLQKDIQNPDLEEAFSRIYNSGKLLLTIINDLLDLSKIEAGKLQIAPAEYDVPSLIYDTMQLNLLRFENKYIEFKLKIDKNTPHDMYGDELRIKQILNNILSNAFKYTDDGEIELSVWSETEENGMECLLVFSISDTGQGMSEEQISALFEEYTRFNLDTNRTTVGTGLGMTITKRLLNLMEGDICVESKPGMGSTFLVRLPQIRIGNAVCGIDMAEKLRSNRFQNVLKLRNAKISHEYMPYGSILVVDDVESNLYVAKGMMMPYGLQIETAVSGIEAIEKISRGKVYDIVFMDHMMPQMDGIEATKRLRDLGYQAPIVALTANAVSGQAEMFLQNGFDAFISKPIDIRELNASLIRLIRDKQPPEVIEAARNTLRREEYDYGVQNVDANNQLIKMALADIDKALLVLNELLKIIDSSDEENMKLFTTTIHGLKSALLHLGEAGLSIEAFKLEQAGNQGDLFEILAATPAIIEKIIVAVKKHKIKKSENAEMVSSENLAVLREHLTDIRKACSRIKKSAARASLEILQKIAWPKEINDLLDEIALYLLHGEFKKAVAAIDKAVEMY
jgi:CheY-like chemotaxis protein/nitrogen-specific signal transduction histidine kinase/ferredoxin